MKINGDVIRVIENPILPKGFLAAVEWVKRNVTRENLAVAGLGLGTYALFGYVIFVLHQAVQY